MKLPLLCAAAFLSLAGSSFAAAPADAPPGTTGVCKDGSFVSAPDKKGACRGHKGVKDWYATPAAAATTTMTGTSTAPPGKPGTTTGTLSGTAPAPGMPPVSAAPKSPRANGAAFTPAATPAPGGGPGMVWANDSSKVYHCSTDKWYGKTKHGAYMSEADAKAKGFHAEHAKACA